MTELFTPYEDEPIGLCVHCGQPVFRPGDDCEHGTAHLVCKTVNGCRDGAELAGAELVGRDR